MTITAQIAKRMAAAQQEKAGHLKELSTISNQARKRHDQVAAGKGKVSEEGRSAVLDGLLATADFCDATIASQRSQPKERAHHGTRDNGGKFSKPGSFGHLQRMASGKE